MAAKVIPRPPKPLRASSSTITSIGSKAVPLASRTHIDLFDNHLAGEAGANVVINKIRSARGVTRLNLSLNALGDMGCVTLFGFLRSDEGKTFDHIGELSLNSNEIGDVGLLALSEWLRDHEDIRDLYLQNNLFSPSDDYAEIFASSVNHSQLRTLSLNTNRQLSDTFVTTFLSRLNSMHLRDLQLSDIGLTPNCRQDLAAFVRRCHLQSLKLNANGLGSRGVWKMVSALERNHWLTRLELLANRLAEGEDEPPSSSDDEGSSIDVRKLESRLRIWTIRNEHFQRDVHRDAVRLLRYARPALMRSWWQEHHQDPAAAASIYKSGSAASCPVRRVSLPPELVLKILDFTAPTLSISQRSRVYDYARDRTTLPTLTLQLPGVKASSRRLADGPCIPDPTAGGTTSVPGGMEMFGVPTASNLRGPLAVRSLPATPAATDTPVIWSITSTVGQVVSSKHSCANGCMGGLRCRREEARTQWLEEVGCFWYDP